MWIVPPDVAPEPSGAAGSWNFAGASSDARCRDRTSSSPGAGRAHGVGQDDGRTTPGRAPRPPLRRQRRPAPRQNRTYRSRDRTEGRGRRAPPRRGRSSARRARGPHPVRGRRRGGARWRSRPRSRRCGRTTSSTSGSRRPCSPPGSTGSRPTTITVPSSVAPVGEATRACCWTLSSAIVIRATERWPPSSSRPGETRRKRLSTRSSRRSDEESLETDPRHPGRRGYGR